MLIRAVFFLSILMGVSASLADTVVILGTHRHANVFASDPASDLKIQRSDTCSAIQSAIAIGQTVALIAPSISCPVTENGKTRVVKFEGRCGGGDCSKARVSQELKRLASELRKNPSQNLLIQTVGHGLRDFSSSTAPPESNLLGLGNEDLSAAELAKMVNQSGIPKSVDHIRGLWFQCYSGGWNEMARLIGPPGKFCSVSNTTYLRQATVTEEEYKSSSSMVKSGSAFIQGFWGLQNQTHGSASLSDSTGNAALLLRSVTPVVSPSSEDWQSSSVSLFERATKTGAFAANYGESDSKTPPKAYFGKGYSIDAQPLYRAFAGGLEKIQTSSEDLRERYRTHLTDTMNEINSKWTLTRLWTGESVSEEKKRRISNPFLIRTASCSQPLLTNINPAVAKLRDDFMQIDRMVNQSRLESIAPVVRAKTELWKAELEINRLSFNSEMIAYRDRVNFLLEKSGRLMRELRVSGTKDYSRYKSMEAEYAALEKEFRDAGSLRYFPAMKKMSVIGKESEQLKTLLSQINRSDIPETTRSQILSAWECENSPVFKTAKSGDAS